MRVGNALRRLTFSRRDAEWQAVSGREPPLVSQRLLRPRTSRFLVPAFCSRVPNGHPSRKAVGGKACRGKRHGRGTLLVHAAMIWGFSVPGATWGTKGREEGPGWTDD